MCKMLRHGSFLVSSIRSLIRMIKLLSHSKRRMIRILTIWTACLLSVSASPTNWLKKMPLTTCFSISNITQTTRKSRAHRVETWTLSRSSAHLRQPTSKTLLMQMFFSLSVFSCSCSVISPRQRCTLQLESRKSRWITRFGTNTVQHALKFSRQKRASRLIS